MPEADNTPQTKKTVNMQSFLNSLRANDLSGFVAYRTAMDKKYNAMLGEKDAADARSGWILTECLALDDIQLTDIKKLFNLFELFEDMKEHGPEYEDVQGRLENYKLLLKEVSSALISVLAIKQNETPEVYEGLKVMAKNISNKEDFDNLTQKLRKEYRVTSEAQGTIKTSANIPNSRDIPGYKKKDEYIKFRKEQMNSSIASFNNYYVDIPLTQKIDLIDMMPSEYLPEEQKATLFASVLENNLLNIASKEKSSQVQAFFTNKQFSSHQKSLVVNMLLASEHLPLKVKAILLKASGIYSFAAVRPEKSSRHLSLLEAKPNNIQQFEGLKGDVLKTRILLDFQAKLNKVDNEASLNELLTKIANSKELKILERGQGIVTRVLGQKANLDSPQEHKKLIDVKTDSVRGLEQMIEQTRERIKETRPKP